ncbi:M14 family metallopeptidase [Salinimicrobium sp. TH3]|uniref:M14 family metallopeptidase n=1 Tax=Salinimicrobium sp. TH3 TaxID=2997342 RepID=UPI0022768530|nr:M14 metallopeptidase family protein [Salinimicrobium sp. TH3]MCY2687138.1 M14 family metallopeptidase [Salinimicrobium sp. TH3]
MKIVTDFLDQYEQFTVPGIHGRFLDFSNLEKALKEFGEEYEIKEVGRSFLNIPILSITIGTGSKKIFAWSQMHGNETTTTKGVLDLLLFFNIYKDHIEVKKILEQCTLLILPMVNPDGAARYTRENVNKVDLNRDASDLHEPESRVLRNCFLDFKPDFCFNLHDQRTIFGAGDENLPATLSFLAPSMDAARTVTPVRTKAMKVIVAMNTELQKVIPGQVGRFDDGFNINCTGDYFTAQNVPTILFECGHFPQDYLREKTRRIFTYSLLMGIKAIATGDFVQQREEDYFGIPENKKSFLDVILRNASIKGRTVDVGIQFSEKIKGGEVHFEPQIQNINEHLNFFGHKEIDCKGKELEKTDGSPLIENDIVEVILLNKEKLSIKSPQIP